ncbi:MAG TPA: PqqD family protein [Vicinamibacterales bacterium]|nr:PqqD family protein [Vicinamibacterales bacterium]
MTKPSLDDRLAPTDQVVVRELAGESVILDLKSGAYFGLNGVGTRAWGLMAQGGSLRDINAALTDEYDAPSTVIQEELLKFAADLCNHGLCRISERGDHV